MDSGPPSKPRLCRLQRGADGYGFNLHGEKGQHGQYIRAVDEGSSADLSGLRSGDRVIEVDGVNIERETHSQVVARIRSGGDGTCLLVVDRELDAYCRKQGVTIKESMVVGRDESPRLGEGLNGEHEVEVEVRMNGDVTEDIVGELITAKLEMAEESTPERDDDDYNERREELEERREEMEERVEEALEEREEEERDAYPGVTAAIEAEEEERREELREEMIIQAVTIEAERSVPDMAPPVERDDDFEGNVPEPEPEPVLEAATVPLVESAPPPSADDTDGFFSRQQEWEPEPIRAPTPEPVRVPTPEPIRVPTPEPIRAPTPEPVRAPTPEPVRVPTPEPVRAPVKKISAPPPRPSAVPTQNSGGLDLSDMEKARILATGRKKKKAASNKKWEDKYAAFNNL